MSKLLEYFNGDEMASSVWKNKYAIEGEETPEDMHRRMAKEFARTEAKYKDRDFLKETDMYHLSNFGKKFVNGEMVLDEDKIFFYFDRFRDIIPQGSIMSALGEKRKIQSLSNCFVIPSPSDSYGGIFKTDQQIAQIEKRRGGVGLDISTLRPDNTPVSNAAGTSTGAHSFMERFSNTTREVAQNGRRGALMLLMDVRHPDIFNFVTKKKDRIKVTGANVSVMLTDKFMRAVQRGEDFVCTFPVDTEVVSGSTDGIEYNTLYTNPSNPKIHYMKINAQELFTLIVEMAWDNAEPGIAFIDRVKQYCPEGVYPQYLPVACNPCGEQWLQAHDACRLLAANLFSLVVNPFKPDAYVDMEKCYEVFYIQQRLADDIVDLEIEYVQRIIDKIKSDPQDNETKLTELLLWENVQKVATASRRTGCGFTGLADMLAALGLKYDSAEGIKITELVMKTKLKAELDCTIDLGILRGTFEGWDREKEFGFTKQSEKGILNANWYGHNDFIQMIIDDFPEQAVRMHQYGRRNVSWSTLAPTGTVSVIAMAGKYPNISSGGEPQFALTMWRKRKVNPSDKEARVDEVDANGDSWQIYPVVMGAFKTWYIIKAQCEHAPHIAIEAIDRATKEDMEKIIKESPWYGSTANDIDWKKRIEMQAVIQKYTTNAISSTLNLPKDVSKEVVAGIYTEAWKAGLKGVTVYRDGCRDGVLLHNKSSFDYKDASKRPKELDGNLHLVTVKGVKYAVVVGKIDNKPYEIFAFTASEDIVKNGELTGKISKVRKGHYNFINGDKDHTIKDLQIIAENGEEQTLTRLISGMLRHGAKPQFVMEQIDKCELEVVSFGKAISRILKKYVKEEELLSRAKCSDCGSTDIRMQEGCQTCNSCGSSKCG